MQPHLGAEDVSGSFLVELGELDDPIASTAKVASVACQLPAKIVADGEDWDTPFAQVLERFDLVPAEVE
eukprot:13949808-Alexandrium_andersonii.AAC.1